MTQFDPDRLRIARELSRHTQASLAGSIGLTRNAIAQYESGKNVPGANVLARLTRVLGKPYDYFFIEQETPSTKHLPQEVTP